MRNRNLLCIIGALIIALSSTACASWRAPQLVTDVSSVTTPDAAKKALAQAQLVRVAVRDSVADAYVAKLVDDKLVLQIHAIDGTVTDVWRRASRVADDWAAIGAGGDSTGWQSAFQAILNELHREILRMQAEALAGGVK